MSEWLSIDTAPRDGEPVFLWYPNVGLAIGYWDLGDPCYGSPHWASYQGPWHLPRGIFPVFWAPMLRDPTQEQETQKNPTSKQETQIMKDNNTPIMIDPPLVTPYRAIDLCIHYLAMAATYFEAVPDDKNELLNEEIEDQIKDEGARDAALLWAEFMLKYYKSLRGRFDGDDNNDLTADDED